MGFDRVAVWIPNRVLFAQGQGYTTISKGKIMDGLFLVLLNDALHDRQAAREFLRETFKLSMDAINAFRHARRLPGFGHS